jgi:hypothetical protein
MFQCVIILPDAQDDRSGGCFWPGRVGSTQRHKPLKNNTDSTLSQTLPRNLLAHEKFLRNGINPQLTLGEIDIPNIVIDPKSRDGIPQRLNGLQSI